MTQDENDRRRGSLSDDLHRPRPRVGLWTRLLSAVGCLVAGVSCAVRGFADGDTLWLWLAAGAIVVAVVCGAASVVLYRRGV